MNADDTWLALRRLTDARIGLGRSGVSLPTAEVLRFGVDHARARDAVHTPFDTDAMAATLQSAGVASLTVHSAAPDRATYLRRPDLGRRLCDADRERLAAHAGAGTDLLIVIGDGLSSTAVHHHAPPLLQALRPRLDTDGWAPGPVVLAHQARVALGDDIADGLQARAVLVLIGERPGLSSPDSLGAYLTWAPYPGCLDAQRNCVSNIRPQSLGYEAAARKLAWLLAQARRLSATGVALKDESDADGGRLT